ncbi:hypothetical protein DFJ43DRAFT_1040630 [Lentinula guzmanii]|uniref:Uncharacterized protein n=1 Tax=Lentinula guzmanii TaxID=2804957 RepID=A0AA38MSS2_9AGAR|nr:hypothetical protein DFJ43DRAFT_1040630 [Lentinula guzmanii]
MSGLIKQNCSSPLKLQKPTQTLQDRPLFQLKMMRWWALLGYQRTNSTSQGFFGYREEDEDSRLEQDTDTDFGDDVWWSSFPVKFYPKKFPIRRQPNCRVWLSSTVAPSQNPQQNAEEIAALREETARANRAGNTKSPPAFPSSTIQLLPQRRENREWDYDRYYDRERDYERDNRGPPYDREYRDRERGYERVYRYRGHDSEFPRGAPVPPRLEQREGSQGTCAGNDRSLSSSNHAPTPPRSIPTRIEHPPVIPINLAASPHNPNVSNTFDDPMYVTIEEKIATTSLLLYGPTDNLHEDCMWDSNTGACVLVGEAMRQITQRNGPVVLPPPVIDSSNPLIETNSESAVDAAKKLMDKADEPRNFNALWTARQLYWQAKRTIHLEEGLGYTSERSTLPSHLRANLQLYVDRRVTWADKPNTQSFVGEPWDTERDPNKPKVPSLATPDLRQLGAVAHREHHYKGAPWNHLDEIGTRRLSHHADSLTAPSSHTWNFVLHFIDIVAIPDLYGQKLSELELIANSGARVDFKPNSSIFAESSDVVKHLAECGVSVNDMAEGFAFGQQWIFNKTGDLEPHSLEFRRYTNLLKRSRARLQFTHVVPVDNRSWTLPEEWEMEEVVEHQRRKHVQHLYQSQKMNRRLNLEGEGVTDMIN